MAQENLRPSGKSTTVCEYFYKKDPKIVNEDSWSDSDESAHEEMNESCIMEFESQEVESRHANNRTRNEVSSTRVLELLQLDLFGLSPNQNHRGNFYTLMIVDDHSNYTWVVFNESNDDVLGKFRF
nr:retrovirus-related Pol polyprotein from transposon TNT 1-94 [Tanacetum cinerariifolium]